jgi:Predicted hydrolase of the alpha/beta superfamily
VTESVRLHTTDSVSLDAELGRPDAPPRVGVVLCHPHPLAGGTMHATVVDALFRELPAHGISCLRFDFRGVRAREGAHDEGDRERLDVEAAVSALDAHLPPATPMILAGWSFGADVALSVVPERIAAWFAVAPPLHFARDPDAAGADPRPKLLALAGSDEIRPAFEVLGEVKGWTATQARVIPMASHFFDGETDELVTLAVGLADRLTR